MNVGTAAFGCPSNEAQSSLRAVCPPFPASRILQKARCPAASPSPTTHPGRLAQLVRAPALQAGGRRFESCTAHQFHASIVVIAGNDSVLLSGPFSKVRPELCPRQRSHCRRRYRGRLDLTTPGRRSPQPALSPSPILILTGSPVRAGDKRSQGRPRSSVC